MHVHDVLGKHMAMAQVPVSTELSRTEHSLSWVDDSWNAAAFHMVPHEVISHT